MKFFEDDNKNIFETGNIIFADLILRDQSNLYIIIKKKKVRGIMILMEKV